MCSQKALLRIYSRIEGFRRPFRKMLKIVVFDTYQHIIKTLGI